LEISGYLEIDGRRYHAEDVLYALMKQGITVEVLENQDYALRIDNKLIDNDTSLDGYIGKSCPFIEDFNRLKEKLDTITDYMKSNGRNSHKRVKVSRGNGSRLEREKNSYGKDWSNNVKDRNGLNSLMNRLYSENNGQKQNNPNNFMNQKSSDNGNGSRKNSIPYKYLSKPSKCAYCGSNISENTKYCYNCGKEVIRHSRLTE